MTAGSHPRFYAGDVSVVVSVKVDSPQRLRNLELWSQYLGAVARGIEKVVVEQSTETAMTDRILNDPDVRHQLIPSADCHWKTRNLNIGAKIARGPLLLFIDCDVLLPPAAMEQALQRVRADRRFVQPFNGVMVEFREERVAKASDALSLMARPPHLPRNYDKDMNVRDYSEVVPLYGGSSYHATGGAIACDRSEFFTAGGYNENFVSYGFEDMEFFERVVRLGYQMESLADYNAYHLPHPRSNDSVYNNYYRCNEREYKHVMDMSTDALRRYVWNGFRTLRFTPDAMPRIEQDATRFHVDLLPDTRTSLQDVELIFVVHQTDDRHSDPRLERIFRFLEENFTAYRITLYEIGSRTLRHPVNMSHYDYKWLDGRTHPLAAARRLAIENVNRRFYALELVGRDYEPGPLIARLGACIGKTGFGESFTKRRDDD